MVKKLEQVVRYNLKIEIYKLINYLIKKALPVYKIYIKATNHIK